MQFPSLLNTSGEDIFPTTQRVPPGAQRPLQPLLFTTPDLSAGRGLTLSDTEQHPQPRNGSTRCRKTPLAKLCSGRSPTSKEF